MSAHSSQSKRDPSYWRGYSEGHYDGLTDGHVGRPTPWIDILLAALGGMAVLVAVLCGITGVWGAAAFNLLLAVFAIGSAR